MTRFTAQREIYKRREENIGYSGIWNPRLSDWRDVIEDYQRVARSRYNNKLAMFKLQANLLQDIRSTEESIRLYKGVLNDDTKRQVFLKADRQFTDAEVAMHTNELQGLERLRKTLKEVTDGHLWRMFSYNRALMYLLGRTEDPGHLSMDDGFLNELYRLGEGITRPEVFHFVLNDLTNYARIGDIIEADFDGVINITEVKSSNRKNERTRRQRDRRDNFINMANNGEGLIDGRDGRIHLSRIPVRSHLGKLSPMLKRAAREGYVFRQITEYLRIVVLDTSAYESVEEISQAVKRAEDYAVSEWDKTQDTYYGLSSSLRNTFSTNFTPLTVFPIDDPSIADILLGKVSIFYYFNMDALIRRFETAGWKLKARLDRNPDANPKIDPTIILHKHGFDVTLGAPQMNQIVFDMFDISTMISTMESHIGKHYEDDRLVLVHHIDQERFWN